MIIPRFGRFLLGALLLAAVLCWTGCDGGTVHVDFEDLASGATYHVGDVFVDSSVTMAGAIYWWNASTSTDTGVATVQAAGDAGSTGKELWFNNINIVFNFGGPCQDLTLHLGEYGGNLNIMINGDSASLPISPISTGSPSAGLRWRSRRFRLRAAIWAH